MKQSCHGVYVILNLRITNIVMKTESTTSSPLQRLSPCVMYAGKLKNGPKRAISHVTAAKKPWNLKNSKTVRKIRYLLRYGIDVGVIVVNLCNQDVAFAVESQLLHGFTHLVNSNKGHLHKKFPDSKIKFLTSLCLSYILSKITCNAYDYVQKSNK